MEIGTNPETWGRMPAGGASPLLDWQGLRARLLAGYATRHELGGPASSPRAGGSFDARFARIINGFATPPGAGLASVNPTPSADGNSPTGNIEPVAGNKRPTIEE